VVSAQFEWSDLGSFESVYDYLKQLVIPWISTAIWLLEPNNYTAFVGVRDTIFYTPTANLISNNILRTLNVYSALEKAIRIVKLKE
jgi:mannose-1-phosphate guanylyltransferase